LEEFAHLFDDVLANVAQRRSFRAYLQGLLLPRDRHKTLTGLAGTEPVLGAQDAPAQRLQFFLSEADWEAEAVNARRLELLLGDPGTEPHEEGVLVIDDSGYRKDGTKTDHVARQYLGNIGKIDNGIVAVSSLWADEALYYPLHVIPYTPAERLPKGKQDPAFRTKPQLAVQLIDAALEMGISFRAVVADCFYGENGTFERALRQAGLPFVLGLKASHAIWAPADAIHSPQEALEELDWNGPEDPGNWTSVVRHFRDGHEETWWAVELSYGPYGPAQPMRIIVTTTDPATLPALSTWYLLTNLPHPEALQVADSPIPPAELAEVVRLYGLRNWVEQSYKQTRQELGWADFMVRDDRAIRRHWQLVCCAFSFCWRAWFARADNDAPVPSGATAPEAERGKKSAGGQSQAGRTRLLAEDLAAGAQLVGSLEYALALLARVVGSAPASRAPSAPRLGRSGPAPPPLSPSLTNYR
jgi:hypothetical protein